jgi:hypothetical protein
MSSELTVGCPKKLLKNMNEILGDPTEWISELLGQRDSIAKSVKELELILTR